MELPLQFTENMKALLGDAEYLEYKTSFGKKSYSGLRFNLLKCKPSDISGSLAFPLTQVPWCPEGRYYPEAIRPAKQAYYSAGLYYLQEPSAMSSAALLPISEGDRVLDLCAAPGGKATQLAVKLQGSGILFANDISAGRTKALLKNIELFGIKNAICLSEAPNVLSKRFPGFFDKILIDAPCTGEGMFRREPDMIKSWNAELITFCRNQQKDILQHGAKMLKPGGLLLYSTCTFSPLENESSILEFLKEHEDFSLLPIEKNWGFQEGLSLEANEALKACVRLYPHKLDGEGHFLALLKKSESNSANNDFSWEMSDEDPRMTLYYDFCNETLEKPFIGKFKVYGDSLCLLPDETPSLKGLRVLRSGWQLGNFKKNRFEPSQALAMGLKKAEVKNSVDFPLEDHRVIRYLKGETVEVSVEKQGWHVVFVDGFPLGFGKVQNGRLKNKYPASWKWE